MRSPAARALPLPSQIMIGHHVVSSAAAGVARSSGAAVSAPSLSAGRVTAATQGSLSLRRLPGRPALHARPLSSSCPRLASFRQPSRTAPTSTSSPVLPSLASSGLPSASSASAANWVLRRAVPLAGRPQRRSFVASNAMLRSEDSSSGGGGGGGKDDKTRASPSDKSSSASKTATPPPPPPPSAASLAKRKPRAAGAKNSLRRVAAIAQQPTATAARPATGKPAAAPKTKDDAGGPYGSVEDLEGSGPASVRAAATSTGGGGGKASRQGKPGRRAAAAAAEEATAAEDDEAVAEEDGVEEVGPRADGSNVISAVCLAESFDMQQVSAILQAQGYRLDPDGSGFESHEVVHGRRTWPREAVGGGGNGFAVEAAREVDLFVFESGTLVGWGLPEDAVDRLATEELVAAAADPFVDARETETLEFRRDATRETSAMRGSDVVVLGVRDEAAAGDRLATTRAQIAFSSGLARSTKLAALERSFSDYFESTRRIPAMLAAGRGEGGSARVLGNISQRFIVQKTGELLSLRAQLNHYRELTDALPDIFWDARAELGLESYYEQVGRALDVGVRIKTLNQKMDYAQEIATVLREISSERHGTRLEWIIIVLITVEVVFELRRVYLERQERLEREAERAERAKRVGEGKEASK